MIFIDQLKAILLKKGRLATRPGEINIVGIRNTQDKSSDRFNDSIVVLWIDEDDNRERIYISDATTDPGLFYRQNPMNVEGCAILPEGFYPDLWQVGLHQNRYEALVQKSPVKVWRDNDKDANIDIKIISKPGMYGINLHRANKDVKSTLVQKWSAGCQVIADPSDFSRVMRLATRHAELYKNSFDYLLIADKDLT